MTETTFNSNRLFIIVSIDKNDAQEKQIVVLALERRNLSSANEYKNEHHSFS